MNEPELTNQVVSPPLSPSASQGCRLGQAQEILIISGHDKRLEGDWRQHCHAHQHPFIRVRLANKFATVYVKLAPTQQRFSPEHRDAIAFLCDLVRSNPALIGPDMILCYRVPLQDAQKLARLFHWILTGSTPIEESGA